MRYHSNKGQGLLLIAMVIVLMILVIAVLYRVFTMTPAYIYQRSIYYAFKYTPQVIVQEIVNAIQSIVLGYARNYSQFLVNNGVLLYIHALTQYPTPYSLANVINTQVNLLINSMFVPTGLAVPTTEPSTRVTLVTGFYGALSIPGIHYVYSGGTSSMISVLVNSTYDMPTLGIQGLTIQGLANLTATIINPSTSTCNGGINPETLYSNVTCKFNFTTNNYTCTGPSINASGQANNLWAPSQYAINNGALQWVRGSGWVDSNKNGFDVLVFAYPVDEITGNAGFRVSALFRILPSSNNYVMGFELLTPCPAGTMIANTLGSCNGGYTIYIKNNYLYVNNNQITKFKSISNVNVTVIVTWNQPIQLISSSQSAQMTIYINGTPYYPGTVTLPTLHQIPNTVFGNTAYMMSGNTGQRPLGSWMGIILQNAAVTSASVSFINKYTLPRNVYVEVSYNNAPALGTEINLYRVTPITGAVTSSVNYTACNITSNAIIFNVTMPWPPRGYPTTQYLLAINYSGIVLLLNPWSPGALAQMGISNPTGLPSGYSASSIVPYIAYLLNETSNSLIELVYFANPGIPTLLSIYGGTTGLYITNIITQANYAVLGNVAPLTTLNIMRINNKIPMGLLRIFTFNESLYNLATGYTVIGQVIPPKQTQEAGINTQNYPGAFYNLIVEYMRFPNQTLPYTYFNYTILNCRGTSIGGNQYSNYAIYFTYNNGQLMYLGYTPPSKLPPCQQEQWW
ncbi:hypothetical protein [Vulcanisaeta thermophila]|uniref:hypothetical protein n=1 Tax=Vulcanisaeta thermophila TaxID=867917 RepID=UPI001EE36871|nr:hypothetical protein [Vulcanisaeta thermophila]